MPRTEQVNWPNGRMREGAQFPYNRLDKPMAFKKWSKAFVALWDCDGQLL